MFHAQGRNIPQKTPHPKQVAAAMWNLFTATITLRTDMREWWAELHCFAYLRLCLHFCFAEFLFFQESEDPACIWASAKGISETLRRAPRTGAFWSKYPRSVQIPTRANARAYVRPNEREETEPSYTKYHGIAMVQRTMMEKIVWN